MKRKIDIGLIGEILSPDKSNAQSLTEQIAVVFRYLIATNAIKPGEILPGLRDGAAALGVNLHTLREAYRLLGADGYVEIVPSVGVRALSSAAARNAKAAQEESLDGFLDRFEWEAKRNFGLDADDLADLLHSRATLKRSPEVSFVECSLGQAKMHADQVSRLIGRECTPVVIREGAPRPRGFSVTTLFHLDDIERIWPGCCETMHFVHINISKSTAKRINDRTPQGARVTIYEYDINLGNRIARDIASMTKRDPRDFTVKKVSGESDFEAMANTPLPAFVSPRLWNRLPDEIRSRKKLEQIMYDIDEIDAPILAKEFKRYEAGRRQRAHEDKSFQH